MRAFFRFVVYLLVAATVVGGGAWWWSGRSGGPVVDIRRPLGYIGESSTLDLMVQSPGGQFGSIEAAVEQAGRRFPVFSLDRPDEGTIRQDAAERLFVMRPVGRSAIADLQEGPARVLVRASRPALFGLRQLVTDVSKDVVVRLTPPRVAALSTFHFVNHGGSEFVVYRVTPEDVQSGVRVGNIDYQGFPASGAGITSDPALRVAFFALTFEQDRNTSIQLYARDPADNETLAPLDHRVLPKTYARSRITIDDRFIERVVPAIAASSPAEQIPTTDMLAGFLEINGSLRRKNNQFIAELVSKTSPELLFDDAFQQLSNSQVESGFADTRTYIYKGQEVDRQVHLGFDLAVTANVPIVAAQRGIVVYADNLGIYGNCIVIDHGMGVQSLYGHLSSIGAAVGDVVDKGAEIGRSGMTGLAGGDHLHFTMLVGGQHVTPVDWWSPQWFQDRVRRKIQAAAGVR
jgi:hypothetical protein